MIRHRPPGQSPAPAEIAALRAATGLTQAEFGELLYTSRRQVQDWEGGQRNMPALVWEYANLLRTAAVAKARSVWLEKRGC